MRKSGVVAALVAALSLGSALAHGQSRPQPGGDEFEQGLQTMWEVLWHQSGTPTRVVRWEQDIRVRVTGIDLAQYKDYALQALRTAAAESGLKITDVSDRPDAAQVANLSVEIVPNTMLEDNQPCVTYLNFYSETHIDSAAMQMRARDVKRCAYHESMHAMGVRGHPAGKTVLSYFPTKVDGFLPLDKVMLHAWYSPHMRGGMTPFEAMTVLADELVQTQPDRVEASAKRDKFLSKTVEQMQAFADGSGDVPAIVKRSGKWTVDGVKHGRSEMSYFLGIAYLEGAGVQQDPAMAVKWLQRAASAGNRPAQARLGAFR
jgi:hypothetical protein